MDWEVVPYEHQNQAASHKNSGDTHRFFYTQQILATRAIQECVNTADFRPHRPFSADVRCWHTRICLCTQQIQGTGAIQQCVETVDFQPDRLFADMEWLQLVGSINLYVSSAKETYQRDYILQKRAVIKSILLTEATPYLQLICAYLSAYGVATISRLLKIIRLFCRILSIL